VPISVPKPLSEAPADSEMPLVALSVPPAIVMLPAVTITFPVWPLILVTVSWLAPIARTPGAPFIVSAPIVSLTSSVTKDGAGKEIVALSKAVCGGPPPGVQKAAVDQLPEKGTFQEYAVMRRRSSVPIRSDQIAANVRGNLVHWRRCTAGAFRCSACRNLAHSDATSESKQREPRAVRRLCVPWRNSTPAKT